MSDGEHVVLHRRDLKGSRFGCLMLMTGSRETVASRLTRLVEPHATVAPKHLWRPGGVQQPSEFSFGDGSDLDRRCPSGLPDWWLAKPDGRRTPNWDIAAQCQVGDKKGLLLVEAKAHCAELKEGDVCGARDPENRNRIGTAIDQANAGLGGDAAGWHLSRDKHYQLSNRFAWAWKLAYLDVPVVLVYLGFLNADEMPRPLASHDKWKQAVMDYSSGVVPSTVWDDVVMVNDTPIYPMIRSLDLQWVVGK